MSLTLQDKEMIQRQKKTAKTLMYAGIFFIAFSFFMPRLVDVYLNPFKKQFSSQQAHITNYYKSVKPSNSVEQELHKTGSFLVSAYGENVERSTRVVFKIYYLMVIFIGVLFFFFGLNNHRMLKNLDKYIES